MWHTPGERHRYHSLGFLLGLAATAPPFPQKPDFRSKAETQVMEPHGRAAPCPPEGTALLLRHGEAPETRAGRGR